MVVNGTKHTKGVPAQKISHALHEKKKFQHMIVCRSA